MNASVPAVRPAASTGEPSAAQIARLKERALFVRLETVRLIGIAKVGHYASAFSAAEIFATLYYDTCGCGVASRGGRTATGS